MDANEFHTKIYSVTSSRHFYDLYRINQKIGDMSFFQSIVNDMYEKEDFPEEIRQDFLGQHFWWSKLVLDPEYQGLGYGLPSWISAVGSFMNDGKEPKRLILSTDDSKDKLGERGWTSRHINDLWHQLKEIYGFNIENLWEAGKGYRSQYLWTIENQQVIKQNI